MARRARNLVIDARPRGPRGPLAGERVQGRSVLDHLLDLAQSAGGIEPWAPVAVHARHDEHELFRGPIEARPEGRFVLAVGPPPEGSLVLRADRLYDPAKLRRALRRGKDPESAVIWRLDRPQALEGADDELKRRQTYQPLGCYWALGPARRLARALAPTRVRPNAVTLAAAALMLAASGLLGFGPGGLLTRLLTAALLASALVLDTADGHLARLQGTASEFGRWLDAWLDELCDMALHAAAAWSAFLATGRPGWLLAGMVYGMGKYMFLVGSNGPARGQADGGGAEGRVSWPRRVIHLAGHADVRWHLWIVLAAAGRFDAALAAYTVYFPARAALGLARKAARHA
jgi:hypothetical protein